MLRPYQMREFDVSRGDWVPFAAGSLPIVASCNSFAACTPNFS